MIYDYDDGERLIAKKLEYFLTNSIAVHIKKKNGEWLNGYSLNIYADYVSFNEFIKGEIIIFFLEIEEITEYKKEGWSED